MVLINNTRKAGIFKVRLTLADAYGDDYPEQRDAWADAWVDLREITAKEAISLQSKAAGEALIELLPDLIIGHNFQVDEAGTMATKAEVSELILESGTVMTWVLTEYQRQLPLLTRNGPASRP